MNGSSTSYDYYLARMRFDGSEKIIIWYSSNEKGATSFEDGVIVVDGRVPYWCSVEAVASYAHQHEITIRDIGESTWVAHDVDAIRDLVAGGEFVDASNALIVWNMFSDIARSVQDKAFIELDEQMLDPYNHVFYLDGNIAVENTDPDPLSPEEVNQVRQVMSEGLRLIRDYFVAA